ncbi:MAG TPA: alcohol dehydrogenase catalytic domain-containing protein, partial [Polyangiaceae bacterium]|nr:alcohol dehydrogenase catalytic domain-containing protein [Polyangiaceae bacterium]
MRALVRDGKIALAERAVPALAEDEVLVEVKRAGICRTDVYVADGTLAVREPRVLGHEAAGVVASDHPRLPRGARVAIDPVKPCMLGVDRDGAFADFVAVPASTVHRVPDDLRWEAAAMAEPVAAALGVLRAPIHKRARGAVHGSGRIADLVVRVLEVAGFAPIRWSGPDAPNDLDWVVETRPDALSDLMRA